MESPETEINCTPSSSNKCWPSALVDPMFSKTTRMKVCLADGRVFEKFLTAAVLSQLHHQTWTRWTKGKRFWRCSPTVSRHVRHRVPCQGTKVLLLLFSLLLLLLYKFLLCNSVTISKANRRRTKLRIHVVATEWNWFQINPRGTWLKCYNVQINARFHLNLNICCSHLSAKSFVIAHPPDGSRQPLFHALLSKL